MPGTVLGQDAVGTKPDKIPTLMELPWEETDEILIHMVSGSDELSKSKAG